MKSSSTIETQLQTMAQGFQPQRAIGLNVTYGLQITGEQGGAWTMTIAEQTCFVSPGKPAQADTFITLDYDSFMEFTLGELDIMQAYLQGRLKVEGQIDYALELKELFVPPVVGASNIPAPRSDLTDGNVRHNHETRKGNTMISKRTEANGIVRKHVIWAMGAGLIPVPILDFTAVTAVQIDMLSQLAKLYGVDYTVTTGKTFVAALTGTTFAQIGASIVKAIPGIGTVIGGVSMSVLSGASTYAVAQVAIHYFETGGNLLNIDLDAAKNMYKGTYEQGMDFVSTLEQEQPTSRDIFEKLEKLGHLKEQGVLTEQEFQEQKQKLLDRL